MAMPTATTTPVGSHIYNQPILSVDVCCILQPDGGPPGVVCVNVVVHHVLGLLAVEHINLSGLSSLGLLQFTFQFDLDHDDTSPFHVPAWVAATRFLLSLNHEATLRTLVLSGAFSQRLLNTGWRQSPVVPMLRRPLHNFAHRVSGLIGQGRAPSVVLEPQAPASAYTEVEQRRIASLLPALVHDNLLNFY